MLRYRLVLENLRLANVARQGDGERSIGEAARVSANAAAAEAGYRDTGVCVDDHPRALAADRPARQHISPLFADTIKHIAL